MSKNDEDALAKSKNSQPNQFEDIDLIDSEYENTQIAPEKLSNYFNLLKIISLQDQYYNHFQIFKCLEVKLK